LTLTFPNQWHNWQRWRFGRAAFAGKLFIQAADDIGDHLQRIGLFAQAIGQHGFWSQFAAYPVAHVRRGDIPHVDAWV
jgi:hypothetical protein